MSRSRPRKDDRARLALAHHAARLMAEEGIADYSTAKHKAARQAGLAEAGALPGNEEIENALREYQALYQSDEQPGQLRRLREVALRLMRELESFRPHLVGAVLSGTAGRHSDVTLQLYPEDPKALTLFLLNARRRIEEDSASVGLGRERREVPVVRFEYEDVPVSLLVLAPGDERRLARTGRDGQLKRARIEEVEALLARD